MTSAARTSSLPAQLYDLIGASHLLHIQVRGGPSLMKKGGLVSRISQTELCGAPALWLQQRLQQRLELCLHLIISLLFLIATPDARCEEPADDRGQMKDVVVLSIGRSFQWTIARGTTVSVANGAVIRVTDLGANLKIVGVKVGMTSLRAGSQQLTIAVVSDLERNLYERLKNVIQNSRGPELQIEEHSAGQVAGPTIGIGGRILRLEDWVNLSRVASDLAGAHFAFHAELSDELAEQALTYFRQLLQKNHLPELSMNFQPSATVIVPTEPADLKTRAEHLLSAYGFKVEASPAALSLEPMVRVRLIVAEFRRNLERSFGLEWPDRATAHLLPTLGIPQDLSVTIHALEKNGQAKVLASPTLLCRSGKEAKFLAGGEFPIKIINFKIQDIIWKQYGVLLKIQPKADFSGRMSIGIETEVSMIDDTLKVDGIPGMHTNRIESHFDLTSSQTIILSGLIKQEWSNVGSGLPGLMNLPILGPLFGSRDFRENRSELVVFVTPEIAKPDQVGL